jgi:hypothetical protein
MRSGSLPAGSLTPCIRRGNVSSLSQGFLSEERLSLHEFVSRVFNIFRFDRKGRLRGRVSGPLSVGSPFASSASSAGNDNEVRRNRANRYRIGIIGCMKNVSNS